MILAINLFYTASAILINCYPIFGKSIFIRRAFSRRYVFTCLTNSNFKCHIRSELRNSMPSGIGAEIKDAGRFRQISHLNLSGLTYPSLN